jgi:hypothetical protein
MIEELNNEVDAQVRHEASSDDDDDVVIDSDSELS